MKFKLAYYRFMTRLVFSPFFCEISVMRRLTHLFVLAAFVFSCGGHWYALQGVAWMEMIHDYAQVVPLREAVSMTFSGKYPCALCKVIAEKRQTENTKALALEKYEKKYFPPLAVVLINPADSTLTYPDHGRFFQSRTESPPTPPPRFVLS